jgi:catechol 2,3-dioxygenase-like lactoylglutathione lyase family enzyme
MLPTLARNLDVQVITITVTNLEKSRQFYEDILNFEVKAFYEPTRWISYHCESGAFFAIIETNSNRVQAVDDEIYFLAGDIHSLWKKVKNQANIVEALHETLMGSTQFVITDPDGYKLGFVNSYEID